MENIQKQHNERIEAIDKKISQLQDEKIASLDQMLSEIDKYNIEVEKNRESDYKKIVSDGDAISEKERLEKETKDTTEKKRPIIKTQAELAKMTEAELINYGSTLGLTLDIKGTKASKIAAILSL